MSTPDILLTLAKAAKVRVEKRLHEHSLTAPVSYTHLRAHET